MLVPSLANTSSIRDHLDKIPSGIFKTPNTKDSKFNIELCSFEISDSSKIKKISIWHCFSTKPGALGKDILVAQGPEIAASNDLDHIKKTRCMGFEKEKGLVYFLDSSAKSKTTLDVINILVKIRELSPSWLSKIKMSEVIYKFEAFINIPGIRNLKKMQYEANYLSKSCTPNTSFANFLFFLSDNTLQFEKYPLPYLECLVKHKITTLKEQMISPRHGQPLQLTDPCTFMQANEKRIINQIKRVARKRLFWGKYKNDFEGFPKDTPAYRGTMAYNFRDIFDEGIIGLMAAYDL